MHQARVSGEADKAESCRHRAILGEKDKNESARHEARISIHDEIQSLAFRSLAAPLKKKCINSNIQSLKYVAKERDDRRIAAGGSK